MKSTSFYLKAWQKALSAEIIQLKKYGSTKYQLKNGQFITSDCSNIYYFESSAPMQIPGGATVRIVLNNSEVHSKVLSSEGYSIILSFDDALGENLTEFYYLYYDPWELLDQLHERLEEIKGSKIKKTRIKRLLFPEVEAKHPAALIKSSVHELFLRSKYNPVTFVWGPPGTGKTFTLGRVAANKYFKGKKVLILSQSNQAVDVLMMEIARFVEKKGRSKSGDLLRYGSQSMIISSIALTTSELIMERFPDVAAERLRLLEDKDLIKEDLGSSFSRRDSEQLIKIEEKLSKVLEKIRQIELLLVRDADIIGTTLSKAATDPTIYENTYDLVVIDEASMAYVPQIAFAASLGRRVIICGDFKQLSPIASSRHQLVDDWLREDIFHKVGVIDWLTNGLEIHPHLFILREQRRMHPDISSFTNKYIYNSLVSDHESVKTTRDSIVKHSPFVNKASVLLDSSYYGNYCLQEKSSNSRFNLWQLLLSFQLIHESYLSGVRSIGYVTPYRAQAALMEILLKDLYSIELKESDILASTVHRFQGSERDVMLFDTVDSYPQNRPGMLLVGKDSERLINVAITRTRGKFIHISDSHFIKSYVFRNKTVRQLVDHQVSKNQDIKPQQIGTWVKNHHPRLDWLHAKRLDKVSQDIQNAKHTVMLGLPSGKTLSSQWIALLNNRHKNVTLTLMSNEIEGLWVNKRIDPTVPFPFIIIDKKILWLGLPVEAAENVYPPYVAVRLSSQEVIHFFLGQI